MARNNSQIPEEFKSIEEIQNFWDKNSTADYWNKMEDVDLELSPKLRLQLELKKLYRIPGFSPKQIEEIESKVKEENLSSKQLISKWVLEHI